MTYPTHVALSVWLTWFITKNPMVLHLAGLFGGGPDLGTMFNQYYTKIDRFYNKVHRPWLWQKNFLGWIMIWNPWWVLHLITDYPFHTDDDHSKNLPLMVRCEALIWMGILGTIFWLRGFELDIFGSVIVFLSFVALMVLVMAEKVVQLKEKFMNWLRR